MFINNSSDIARALVFGPGRTRKMDRGHTPNGRNKFMFTTGCWRLRIFLRFIVYTHADENGRTKNNTRVYTLRIDSPVYTCRRGVRGHCERKCPSLIAFWCFVGGRVMPNLWRYRVRGIFPSPSPPPLGRTGADYYSISCVCERVIVFV